MIFINRLLVLTITRFSGKKTSGLILLFVYFFYTPVLKAQRITSETPDYKKQPLQEWEQKFADFEFKKIEKDGHEMPFRIYKPAGYDSKKKYPLVLFMHGMGERGNDDRKQFFRFPTVKFWEKYPCIIIAPQCPDTSDREGGLWVNTNYGDSSSLMKQKPTWPMGLAISLLEKILKDYSIDKNRVYVTGLSMGGFATWELIQRLPKTFTAAMPVCGGGDLAYTKRLTKIPIWAFHGDADDIVLPLRSKNMVQAINVAGGKARLTLFPGVKHGSWTNTYSNPEVWDWLFKQSNKYQL